MRVRVWLLAGLLALLCACAPEEAAIPPQVLERPAAAVPPEPKADVLRIGVSMQGLQRPFIQRVRAQLLEAEKAYRGSVELTILDGQEDPERQNAQIENFVTQKMDAIIFNAVSYEEGALGVELANRSGVPIVLLTTMVAGGQENAQAYAVSDHKESARIQMDMVAEYLGGSGSIAILKGKKGIESEMQRTAGYEEKLEEYPGLHVECQQVANWSPGEARVIVENWLRLGKRIDAIVAQNDNMAVGAIEAVEEAGKQSEIAVFGIDGDIDALWMLKWGRLQGTVYHDAVTQANTALDYAVRLAMGEPVTSETVPFFRVDLDNVQPLLEERGKKS